jgi:hypothetical protein
MVIFPSEGQLRRFWSFAWLSENANAALATTLHKAMIT